MGLLNESAAVLGRGTTLASFLYWNGFISKGIVLLIADHWIQTPRVCRVFMISSCGVRGMGESLRYSGLDQMLLVQRSSELSADCLLLFQNVLLGQSGTRKFGFLANNNHEVPYAHHQV